ncbi:hypothetical protein LIA77_04738 [Sarocladium implicatum]|nr:hypothetical protein LIA77_04738 [Sarocladium implicatum]
MQTDHRVVGKIFDARWTFSSENIFMLTVISWRGRVWIHLLLIAPPSWYKSLDQNQASLKCVKQCGFCIVRIKEVCVFIDIFRSGVDTFSLRLAKSGRGVSVIRVPSIASLHETGHNEIPVHLTYCWLRCKVFL